MRGSRSTAAALVLAALAWVSPARSADQGDLETAFRAWDKNGDGQLTTDEWRGKAPFERADRNGDGVVTLEELSSGSKSRADSEPAESVAQSQTDDMWSRMIEGWDGDDDGLLSTSEWRGRTPHTSFDRDSDGMVTQEEFLSAVSKSGQLEAEPSGPSWERALEAWDNDHDGELTAKEWKGQVPFRKLDADGSGQLTEIEFGTALSSSGEDRGDTSQPSPKEQPTAPRSGEFELLLKAMDSDRDGRVSRDEWNGGTSDWKELDANRDGYVTADEMPR